MAPPETSQLIYDADLLGPLVVDRNHLAGAVIRGALAAEWIRRHDLRADADTDPEFRELFLENGVRFLNAYPKSHTTGERLLPAPRALVAEKVKREILHDLTRGVPREQTVAVEGYGGFSSNGWESISVARDMQTHISRPDRVRGVPMQLAGALFTYDHLVAGQQFAGRLLGTRDQLARLQNGLSWTDLATLRVAAGQSRSSQYGGPVELRLASYQPTPVLVTSERPAGYFVGQDRLVVTLASDLIARDELGEPTAAFPFDELAVVLSQIGVPIEPARLEERCRLRFLRRRLVGGYSAKWGMTRPQVWALEAGGVLVFDGVRLDAGEAARAESASLGERSADGFGRFVINWHGAADEIPRITTTSSQSFVERPGGSPPEVFQTIVSETIRRAARQSVTQLALQRVDSLHAGSISSSLLGRVTEVIRRWEPRSKNALEKLSAEFAALRHGQLAAPQLAATHVEGRPILDHLEGVAQLMPMGILPEGLVAVARAIGRDPSADESLARELGRLYGLTLCSGFARKIRGQRRTGEPA